MIFRESLVVSKVEKDNTLTPVGGLCLDVQAAKGTMPLVRKFQEESYTECLEIPKENDFWADRKQKEGNFYIYKIF